jgi:hypothetical protein
VAWRTTGRKPAGGQATSTTLATSPGDGGEAHPAPVNQATCSGDSAPVASRSRHPGDLFGRRRDPRVPLSSPRRRLRATTRPAGQAHPVSVAPATCSGDSAPVASRSRHRDDVYGRRSDRRGRRFPFPSLRRRVRATARPARPVSVTRATCSGDGVTGWAGASRFRHPGDVFGRQRNRRIPLPSPRRRDRATERPAHPASVAPATPATRSGDSATGAARSRRPGDAFGRQRNRPGHALPVSVTQATRSGDSATGASRSRHPGTCSGDSATRASRFRHPGDVYGRQRDRAYRFGHTGDASGRGRPRATAPPGDGVPGDGVPGDGVPGDGGTRAKPMGRPLPRGGRAPI